MSAENAKGSVEIRPLGGDCLIRMRKSGRILLALLDGLLNIFRGPVIAELPGGSISNERKGRRDKGMKY